MTDLPTVLLYYFRVLQAKERLVSFWEQHHEEEFYHEALAICRADLAEAQADMIGFFSII